MAAERGSDSAWLVGCLRNAAGAKPEAINFDQHSVDVLASIGSSCSLYLTQPYLPCIVSGRGNVFCPVAVGTSIGGPSHTLTQGTTQVRSKVSASQKGKKTLSQPLLHLVSDGSWLTVLNIGIRIAFSDLKRRRMEKGLLMECGDLEIDTNHQWSSPPAIATRDEQSPRPTAVSWIACPLGWLDGQSRPR